MRKCWRQILRYYEQVLGRKSAFSGKKKIENVGMAIGLILFFAYFFYRSFWSIPFLIPIGIVFLLKREKKFREKQRELLRNQFKDAILGIAANLKAGYAVENAFRETLLEMRSLYGPESPIYKELYMIVQGIANHINMETLLKQFAVRSGLDEIQEFADVFSIAKKTGGNLTEIIYETADMIGDKIEVNKQIQVMISAKQIEQNIMNVIPFAIALYIGTISKGYFDVLYHSVTGILIMTVCLLIYLCAYQMGQRLTQINI